MPVPSKITDLSDTASVNFPQDSDSTGSTVASLPRAIQAILKKQFIRGADIAVTGSGAVTIPTENNYFVITGSGFSVSGFSANYNGRAIFVNFSGALTLTNSASFILPQGVNITTAAGDTALFVNETGSTWRALFYRNSVVYAPLASPALTGNPTAPTPTPGDNDTSIATTAFVTGGIATAISPLAPLASPALTGNPTAPTATAGDNDTSIATTAFVTGGIATESALTAKLAGTQTITGVKTFSSGAEPIAGNVSKKWCVFNGNTAGTHAVIAGVGITNITRSSTGIYVITFDAAFADTSYCVMLSCTDAANSNALKVTAKATGTVTIRSFSTGTGGVVDSDEINAVFYHL